MTIEEFQQNIELKVLLLALYKKQDNETFKDILLVMENTRVFTQKVGKKYLKNLKELNFIKDNQLTFLGTQQAKIVENEFKL
jgi:hypothetical protein